jgi:hypothetical protein
MGPDNCEIKIIDKDDYYKDIEYVSFSGLKVFSKCETLYRDLFLDKTYEEPEQDYFVYGKLVDALVTESPEFVQQNFIKVERKIEPENALKYENEIIKLKEEVAAKEAEIAIKPNKTTEKGIASRKQKIEETQAALDTIKHLADKQQVTAGVWKNAEATALALKTHPYFSNMEFNEVTSQQIFTCNIDGIPRKGKLDHLKLSPALTKIYAIWRAKQITLEEMQAKIRELNPNDLWAIITDIKTCYSMKKLEPYNNHYRGQLGFYQDLVNHTLLIPHLRIKCQIFVADKPNNEFKMSELFVYSQESLDELKPDIKQWMHLWMVAMKSKTFISSKAKNGMKQDCYTCSECRFCPFAQKPGDAVIVSGPRFSKNDQPNGEAFSTADALLDY